MLSSSGPVGLSILALATLVGIAYAVWCAKQEARQLSELRKRPLLGAIEWEYEFFGEPGKGHELAIEVLSLLASRIGVHLTQLRPTDRFDIELSSDNKWILDQRVDLFFQDVNVFLKKHKAIRIPAIDMSAPTLAAFVGEIEKMFKVAGSAGDCSP